MKSLMELMEENAKKFEQQAQSTEGTLLEFPSTSITSHRYMWPQTAVRNAIGNLVHTYGEEFVLAQLKLQFGLIGEVKNEDQV